MTRLGNCRLGAILLQLIFPSWCCWKIFYLRMEIVINFSFSRALAEKTLFVKALPKSQSSMKLLFFLLVLAANLQHLCYDSDFVQILNKSLLYLWFKRFISFFFSCTKNCFLLILKQYINNSSLKFCCRLVYCDKFNNFPGVFPSTKICLPVLQSICLILRGSWTTYLLYWS